MESKTVGKGETSECSPTDWSQKKLPREGQGHFVIFINLHFSHINSDLDHSLTCEGRNCTDCPGKLILLAPSVWPPLRGFGEPLLEPPSELYAVSN